MRTPRFGIGFRTRYADDLAAAPASVDWVEILADNHLGIGGPRRALLERLRATHPIALHGVSLSIAGTAPLSASYVDGLRRLADWLEPAVVSDHLCWTAFGGHESHDLLPVARTAAVLEHVAARVARVQDRLGRRLLLENASAYVAFAADEMDEAEFLAALCRRTGCGVLLDVNNLVVGAANLGIDPTAYLAMLPDDAVGYMHLAGHAILPDVRIDTHDADVPQAVWTLFAEAVRRFPAADVIIERDAELPAFARLVEEVRWARSRHAEARAAESGAARDVVTHVPAPRPARPTAEAPSRSWHALQRGFWTRLVDKPLGFDHAADPALERLLDGGRPVRAARGMRVYSDAYTAGLRRALAVNFPALARVLAARDFDRLAAAYLRRHPPDGHGFDALGRHLAAFVRTFAFEADYGVAPEALADMVALEQAQLEVQDAPADDAEPRLDVAALQGLAPDEWPRAHFTLSPTLRVVAASHDVLPVLEAARRDESPARPAPGATAYLVSRSGAGVRTEPIPALDGGILLALARGDSLGAAAAATGAGEDAAATAAARALLVACSRGGVLGLSVAAGSRSDQAPSTRAIACTAGTISRSGTPA